MSAPTALEAGAIRRGIATWNVAGRLVPTQGAGRVERRSPAPLAVLSRRHDELCRQASDPFEIAAVLEAQGLDDRRARGDYAAASVFELGERLYGEVPWRAVERATRPDAWRLPLWRAQLRGLLYGVPAVTAALLPAQAITAAAWVALVVGTCAAVAAAQSISVLGHLLLGRGQRTAFAALCRCVLVAVALLAATAVAGAGLLHGPVGLTAGVGVQLVFVAGATLLVVAGRELLLAAAVLPGCLAVLAHALGRLPAGPLGREVVLLTVAAATVLATAAAALWVAGPVGAARVGTRPVGIGRVGIGWAGMQVAGARWVRGIAPVGVLRACLGRAELGQAGLAAGYGLGLAALISFAILTVVTHGGHRTGPELLVAALPMTATVGTSEYLLHRARGRTARALARTRMLDGFARRSVAELRVMLTLQGIAVTVVQSIVLVFLDRFGTGPDGLLLCFTVGYALLSIGLLLTATLLSLGYNREATALCGAAGGLVAAVAVLPGLGAQACALVQLALIAGLVVVAQRCVVRRFRLASAHR